MLATGMTPPRSGHVRYTIHHTLSTRNTELDPREAKTNAAPCRYQEKPARNPPQPHATPRLEPKQ